MSRKLQAKFRSEVQREDILASSDVVRRLREGSGEDRNQDRNTHSSYLY